MISDQIDPIFRRPTFTPRHYGLDSEQFLDIAIRLVDDRIFILGSLFERFVEKEEEAVSKRGDSNNNAGKFIIEQLCTRVFEMCVESTKRLTVLSDNLAYWAKVINHHKKSKSVMNNRKKRYMQAFLENCDEILRTLNMKICVIPTITFPEFKSSHNGENDRNNKELL